MRKSIENLLKNRTRASEKRAPKINPYPLQIITSPELSEPLHEFSVFLAGSIEMNRARDWQKEITGSVNEDITFYNPRRADWNAEWKQTLEEPQFVQQVEWELKRLRKAKCIFMHFEPDTISPITLLEFGMYVLSDPEKLIVSCPEGYFRKGNLQVTGRMHGVQIYDSIEKAREELLSRYKNW